MTPLVRYYKLASHTVATVMQWQTVRTACAIMLRGEKMTAITSKYDSKEKGTMDPGGRFRDGNGKEQQREGGAD